MVKRFFVWWLKRLSNSIIRDAQSLDEAVRSYKLQNEQWFLDYQDKLNEISVL